VRPVTGRNSTRLAPSRTAIRRHRVTASWPCGVAHHAPASLGARPSWPAEGRSGTLLLGDFTGDDRQVIFLYPARLEGPVEASYARARCERRAGIRTCPWSSRCIGVGEERKPSRSSSRATGCCRRRPLGVSTGRPAGLSITIASASMKIPGPKRRLPQFGSFAALHMSARVASLVHCRNESEGFQPVTLY
jgi:hypothetical protein